LFPQFVEGFTGGGGKPMSHQGLLRYDHDYQLSFQDQISFKKNPH